jgi:iron(III) transport system ATP-binding protein
MDVEIKQLQFRYHPKEALIESFSLHVKEGEICAIQGLSGSGKTTLLRLITGLETPSGGEICIAGNVVFNQHVNVAPEQRAIGMVFQDYALFPHMTVGQNIAFGLQRSKEDTKIIIEQMLQLIGLQAHEHRFPYELSGGQQQRVALARAIAPSPKLLLLDEPFSNLDTELKQQIRKELRWIIKLYGVTTIMVTHDAEDARVLADRIIEFHGASKVASTPPHKV